MTAEAAGGAHGPTVAIAVDAVNDVLAGRRGGCRRATATTPFEDLCFDSLEVAELFAALEDRCGLELDPESAQALHTVGDLSRLRALSRVKA